ncbi:LicD family protein [Shinella zoogloeoides]|uniref:LicD family protein n=1 Tax=Shinella zoogloeoides TaxID=352475 RepID=UPI0027401BD2|nr:LicD family protein [Shinella zoogloeoides]WLR92190.1 LicD family protein [Shinella zoogloeoides]
MTSDDLCDLLPGLVHFGTYPFVVPVFAEVTRVTITAKGHTFLNLSGVRWVVDGIQHDFPGSAEASSKHIKSLPAGSLVNFRGYHSELETNPTWTFEFDRPQRLDEIHVFNRRGIYAARSYDLEVMVETGTGDRISTSNIAHPILAARAAIFADRARRFYGLYPDDAGRRVATAGAELQHICDRAMIGGACDSARSVRLRSDILQSIHHCLKKSQDILAVKALPVAASLCEFLLDRRPKDKNFIASDDELFAVSVILVDAIENFRKADMIYLSDLVMYLAGRGTPERVEREVNKLYARVGNGNVPQPIMFRSHAMAGADLQAKAASHLNAIAEVNRVFASIGYVTAICYGTYLGAIRTGEFIPHDDDVDMVVALDVVGRDKIKPSLDAIVAALTSMGVRASVFGEHEFLKVIAPSAGHEIDVFPIAHSEKEGFVLMHMEQLTIREVRKDHILPFRMIDFYGRAMLAPSTDSDFLADRYGPNWMVPMRPVAGEMREVVELPD